MSQTRFGSLVESLANVAFGYSVAVASNLVVLPAFGFRVSVSDSLLIGGYFTIISVARSFVVRRVFNNWRRWNV